MLTPLTIRLRAKFVFPLVVTLIAAFCGMFLPIAVENTHNVVWESVYGLGFFVAGFFAHGYTGNPVVGIIGLLVWPLAASAIVFFLARCSIDSTGMIRLLIGVLFVVSLFTCVSHETENYLSVHGAPLYWNLYATFY
jgi:hypothetical protein